MSCSSEVPKTMAICSKILPVRESVTVLISDELAQDKTLANYKVMVIDAISSHKDFVHLKHLTVDDIIIVTPKEIQRRQTHLNKATTIIEVAKKISESFEQGKLDYADWTEPTKSEIRERNNQYRNRQRYHNRR